MSTELNNLSVASSSSGLAYNAELVEFEEIQQKLDKWTIPKVDAKEIYRIGTFDFRSKTAIKTVETSFNLDEQDEIHNLLQAADLLP